MEGTVTACWQRNNKRVIEKKGRNEGVERKRVEESEAQKWFSSDRKDKTFCVDHYLQPEGIR